MKNIVNKYKKTRLILLLTVTIFTLIISFFSCSNHPPDDNQPQIDSIENWVGTYECKRHDVSNNKDTLLLLDVKSVNDSVFNIKEINCTNDCEININIKIYDDGCFKGMKYGYPNIKGVFCDNKIFFDYWTITDEYLISFEYIGKKIIK